MKLNSSMIGFLSLLAPLPLFAASIDVEVGGEYHFVLTNSNDGLNPDNVQAKETDFAVKAAKVALRGKLSDQLVWNVLLRADKSPALERYWVTNKVSDQLDVSIGVQKIRTYGWHRRLTSAITPVRAAYLDYNPYPDVMAADFAYKVGGQSFALSFAKDYFDPSATATHNCLPSGAGCESYNGRDVQKQPAVLLEWAGSFGDIQPLVQYSTYDRAKSSIVSAGLRYKTETLDTYVDYTLDTRNLKGVNAVTGKTEDHPKKINGLVVYAELKTGTLTPYAQFSTLKVDDYTTGGAPEPDTNNDGSLNDNEKTFAIGTYFENWGALYRPYLGVAQYAGKFMKNPLTNEKEDRSKLELTAGLTGKF